MRKGIYWMMVCGWFFLTAVCLGQASGTGGWREKAEDAEFLHEAMKGMTDVMVHDIYSPPVASRIYACVSVAGYEAARWGDGRFGTMAGRLHDLGPAPVPEAGAVYCYSLSAVQAMLVVGKAMVISEGTVEGLRGRLLARIQATGIPEDVYQRSLDHGKAIAAYVLAWAGKDHYKETRALEKYDINDETGNWRPTPPAYMKAIEPHWSKMRTYVIDSSRQFIPHAPTPYSSEKGSLFYKDALEVYDAGGKLTAEQRAIANFWDCNPFKMNVNGHVMYASKKISPGGHWMNITATACRAAHSDYIVSARSYVCVAVVIADAFISCWDEKYRSKAIRPETYINQYISAEWMPLLQTPPFPEYTSGHSVVSACAAVVLTGLYGDHFAFTDSTEMEFGLPPRHFESFMQAADEAAISRFYGGIHFMPAITYGLEEGRLIGAFVFSKL